MRRESRVTEADYLGYRNWSVIFRRKEENNRFLENSSSILPLFLLSYGEIEAKDEKTASSIGHLNGHCFFFKTQSYFLIRDKTDLALKVHGCVVFGFQPCYKAR